MNDTPDNEEGRTLTDAVVTGISLGGAKIEVDGRYSGFPYRHSDAVPASCRRPIKEPMPTSVPPSITLPPETQASPTHHVTGDDAIRANVKAITMIVADAVMSYHEIIDDEDRLNFEQAIHEMANNVHGIMSSIPAGVTALVGRPSIVRDSVKLVDALLKIQLSVGIADFTDHDAESISAVLRAAQEIATGMEMARTKFNPLRSL